MATWLNEYNSLRNTMNEQIAAGSMSPEQLMLYQELQYRIEVLEVCQAFCKTAPVTSEMSAMSGHYKLTDAYIQCLAKERRFGQPSDQTIKAKRETASQNLDKVILDCRKRFSSFQPTGPDQYKKSICGLVNTVLPVWLQLRNTYININK